MLIQCVCGCWFWWWWMVLVWICYKCVSVSVWRKISFHIFTCWSALTLCVCMCVIGYAFTRFHFYKYKFAMVDDWAVRLVDGVYYVCFASLPSRSFAFVSHEYRRYADCVRFFLHFAKQFPYSLILHWSVEWSTYVSIFIYMYALSVCVFVYLVMWFFFTIFDLYLDFFSFLQHFCVLFLLSIFMWMWVCLFVCVWVWESGFSCSSSRFLFVFVLNFYAFNMQFL